MFPNFDIIIMVPKSSTAFYNSPLISGLAGIFGVYIGFWLKEKNELNQYEFFLLSKTNGLLYAANINKIDDFFNELQLDLRAQKLKTYKIVVSALLKAKTQGNYSSEKEEIAVRLEHLKKEGRVSRIRSKLKL